MMCSWNEVEVLATQAALGAGVPPAQAYRFGAAAARHLAEHRDPAVIAALLDTPARIVSLALEVERAVERAAVTAGPHPQAEIDTPLFRSMLEALPCAVEIGAHEITISLADPGKLSRPERLEMPRGLRDRLARLAEQTRVPDSVTSRAGAGASEDS